MTYDAQTTRKDVSNWIAILISQLQEQYRRPNYTEMLKLIDKIQTQSPQVKRALIFLANTKETNQ